MRICMITTFYPPYNFGGDGIFVERLSKELARAGHEVEVVHCTDAYRALRGKTPASIPDPPPGVTVHALRSWAGFFSPLATHQTGRPFFKAKRIREVLARGFDVIHYHNASLVGGPGLLSLGDAVKIYTAHEFWLDCPTHLLMKYGRDVCEQKSCFSCTLVHRRPPQLWRYTRWLEKSVHHLDMLVTPSRSSSAIHRRIGLGVPVHTLPNFIPDEGESIPVESHRGKSEKPYFLFVGRLEIGKGIQTILPAFRELRDFELHIAGRGEYESQLRRQAADLENVRFLGHLTHERLRSLYRDARAVVVPSLWYEVCPLVILEAFQQGTPVLVRRLGGMDDLVEETGAGRSFETSAELLTELRALAYEPGLREDLGARATSAFREKYTAEVHLRRYFELLEEAGARRRAKRSP